jgi:hypothetical protein
MTSTFKWEVLPSSHELGTRPAGVQAREHVLKLLTLHDVVTLDFVDRQATPSFVDELVGGLADALGDEVFRTRVALANVPPALVPLIKHVLASRRARKARSVA